MTRSNRLLSIPKEAHEWIGQFNYNADVFSDLANTREQKKLGTRALKTFINIIGAGQMLA
jgi:hypothetical protein